MTVNVDNELQRIEGDLAVQDGTWPDDQILYHYTNADAFIKIVETKQIWATNVRHLNDRSEVTRGEDLIGEQLEAWRTKLEGAGLMAPIAERLCKEYRTRKLSMMTEIFVASFSTEGNSLSQWRAYAGDGSGYSLGLRRIPLPNDPDYLTDEDAADKAAALVKCVYEEEQFRRLVFDQINRASQVLDASYARTRGSGSLRNTTWDRILTAVGKSLLINVAMLAPAFKDPAFREEKEWRLVCYPRPKSKRSPVNYRASPQGIIPYVSVPLQVDGSPLDVDRVYVGPTLNEASAHAAVVGFLEKQRIDHPDVRPSNIPYRAR